MSPAQNRDWVDFVLKYVLQSVVALPALRDALVFKGARILNLHLNTQRQSLDIDSNMTMDFQQQLPDRGKQSDWFRDHLQRALRNHFENQEPVRFTLEKVAVVPNPSPQPHPRGWNGLRATIHVADTMMIGVRGLPALELEIAAPEDLGPTAVTQLDLNGVIVNAYALHRIAGEKLRAFLSTLPAHRQKMQTNVRPGRPKDLHDLARILHARALTDETFWTNAADEFRLACASRFVDCAGLKSFHENWSNIQQAYQCDATLTAVHWNVAEQALTQIVDFLDQLGTFPLTFPLPPLASATH